MLLRTFTKHRLQSLIKRLLFLAAGIVILQPVSARPQPKSETPAASGDAIIAFLNQTVIWHRQSLAQQQLVSEPNDVLFFNENRQIAEKVVQDSFDFARIQALELPAEETSSATVPTTQHQRISQRAAQAEQHVQQKQKELDGMRQEMAKTAGKKRRVLQARIAETESEVALYQAQLAAMRNLLKAIGQSEGGSSAAGSLNARIEELARTVPFVAEVGKEAKAPGSGSSTESAPAPALPASDHQTAPSGIVGLVSHMFAMRRKINAIDDQSRAADTLVQAAKDVRAPLVGEVRELTKKGEALASQENPADTAALNGQKKELDSLTAQYKQISAILLPLGKQSALLQSYKGNLANWHDAVQVQFRSNLKELALRLGGLGLVLGFVLAIAEIWRRATFRYVTDTRRRYQFLLLRRILLWVLVAMILGFAFSSQLGAVTTFAGLLTAGVAFALQSVLLSVVGYFLLIGKYGMRAGDRVQIAGVTGDVVDIGLVRLHLMEVTGGASPQPTGRVVAFPNSVVFQATSGLFKPIPGTNFLWHEVTVTLGPETNYRHVEQRMLDAVNKVYGEYRDKMEMQRRRMELSLHSVHSVSFAPESRLRLTPAGLEVAIRYPVELGSAAEIDDRVTREILEAIGDDPKLRLLGAQIEPRSA
jgi:small-conductance mechanosensitive channel